MGRSSPWTIAIEAFILSRGRGPFGAVHMATTSVQGLSKADASAAVRHNKAGTAVTKDPT